jgi:hypothetical protein
LAKPSFTAKRAPIPSFTSSGLCMIGR